MSFKRKRVSKKTKKSWRKNIDTSDVDNFLQDQLLQERLGVKHDEQEDKDLFHIDKEGDIIGNQKIFETNSRECIVGKGEKNEIIYESIKSSVRLKETGLPKCFELLEKKSAVPVPIKISKSVQKNAKKQLKLQYKEKAKEKKLNRNSCKLERTENKKNNENIFSYDVWAKKAEKHFNSSWLSNETIRHNLQNTGLHKKKIPKNLMKSSLLPAVEVPHPGHSYNPSLKDHQDILIKAAEKELEVIKEYKHLKRVTSEMFSRVSKEQQEKNWLTEMSVGLVQEKDDSDEDDGQEYKALNPPVKNKKKTLQKRRKLREAMQLKEKLKNQKIEKKKLADIYKLKIFNESLDKRDKRILKNMEKNKQKKLQRPFKTKALSQIKYVEPEIDFQLAEELSGNLRNIVPEGNLILERYKSLQKRNIIQPTVKKAKGKQIVKKYERENTKMDWEKNGKVPLKNAKKKILK